MGSLRLERTAALSLVAVALGFALLLAVLPLPAAASVTTLHVTSGSTSVMRAGVARPATDGEPLYDGDGVATGPGATALLAFTDGSTLTLDPSTTVTVAETSASPGSTVTRIVQTVGRTWSSVQRLASPRSRYEIRTPALTATVRGTAFEVDVATDGMTRVHTVEGAVSVVNGLGEVLVTAGTQTSARPSAPPAPPAAPPPAPLRTIPIGSAPLVVVDPSGRSCGRVEGSVQQQIPGCVVQGDEIRIVGSAASTELRQRELTSPAAVSGVVIVTPRPTARPVEEITVPIIGVIPLQPPRGTTVPIGPDAVAPIVARLVTTTLPPLPSSAPTPQPTAVPAPLPTPALPTVPALPRLSTPTAAPTLADPTAAPLPVATVEPPPLPTLAPTAVPTVAPTILSTTVPTVLPSVSPGVVPAVIPTSSPSTTVAPSPTTTPAPASPTPSPTPTPAPTAAATPAPTATPTPTPAVPLPTLPLPTPRVGLP